MNQPPSPPSAPAEEQIHISRDGHVLGIWPASAIRPMFINGDLKPSDYFWADGAETWQRLVTAPPTAATPYPYLGDDRPFYFIRDGLLFGPRTAAEIEALHASGWLAGNALITFFAADQWLTLDEFAKLGNDDSAISTNQVPAKEFDWIANGIRAWVGDPAAGAEIGIHAVKRAFSWFSSLPSEPAITLARRAETPPADGSKVQCTACGSLILVATSSRNQGECMRCRPRKS